MRDWNANWFPVGLGRSVFRLVRLFLVGVCVLFPLPSQSALSSWTIRTSRDLKDTFISSVLFSQIHTFIRKEKWEERVWQAAEPKDLEEEEQNQSAR